DARPGPGARRQFLAHLLRIGGVLSLAAGVVFFVAANWSEIAVFGRFGLLELLFLGWALLGLPLAVLANWSVSSAAWLLLLNLALALFCGWHPTGGLLWAMLGWHRFEPATVIIGVALINAALWFLFEYLKLEAVPGW